MASGGSDFTQEVGEILEEFGAHQEFQVNFTGLLS
jgi:hypothetical protein